jgi:hypothetical protein
MLQTFQLESKTVMKSKCAPKLVTSTIYQALLHFPAAEPIATFTVNAAVAKRCASAEFPQYDGNAAANCCHAASKS